jgi:PII-like signaling protein
MDSNNKVTVLRIYISSTDKFENQLLFESLVFKAKEFGLSGATVFKGILGFGASSVIHSYKFWEVTDKVPTVVEIIDEEQKIMSYYNTVKPVLENMRYGCLAIIEKVDVLLYKSGKTK